MRLRRLFTSRNVAWFQELSEAARTRVPSELKNVEARTTSPEAFTTLAESLRARNKRTDQQDESKFLGRNNWQWMGADTRLLARSEQLKQLQGRLEFWVEHPDGLTNISAREIKARSLSTLLQQPISELEIILREAKEIVAFQGAG
jgi:hypothetical protein